MGFGDLLRRHRRVGGLTQSALAARSGLSTVAISMLERGARHPRASTVKLLADALRLGSDEREELLAAADGDRRPPPADALPPHGPLPQGSRMPLPPNPLFVGRDAWLLRVAAALRESQAPRPLVACTGMGGLGKTQLAAELVHRYGRFYPGGVYWLGFGSAGDVPLQVAACAGPGGSLEERLERVRADWQRAVSRLLVFDNCEDEALLEAWRPASGGCRVLVTSRRSRWSPTLGVTALPLDVLARPASVELLRRYLPDRDVDAASLDALATEMGDLPLALHLAGSYLHAYGTGGLPEYLAELGRRDGGAPGGTPSPTRHGQSLAQTFALSLHRLDPTDSIDRVAIALLARVARLAPGEDVPRELLDAMLEGTEAGLRADGLGRLEAAGLIGDGRWGTRMHRLLVRFARHEILDPGAADAVERAVVAWGRAAGEGRLTGPALTAAIPHLVFVAGESDGPRRAELCQAAGVALRQAGDLRGARPWLERALAIRERELGAEHPEVAASLDGLALLHWALGELTEAEPLLVRALAIRERALGDGHPETAESLNNLARVLWARADLAAARPLFERALEVRTRTLGPDHRATADTCNDLGNLLRAQGRLAAARPMFERALRIREEALGRGHPDSAESLNNLASLLLAEGEHDAARPLFERALRIREETLGPDHPDTGSTVSGLAGLLRAQGDLSAARPLVERALRIRERALGPDHPSTSNTLSGLARLHQAQGELATARPLFERVLRIREERLGPDHPSTANALNDLGLLYRDEGDAEAARPLLQRALDICERVLGPGHPDTIRIGGNVGSLERVGGGPLGSPGDPR